MLEDYLFLVLDNGPAVTYNVYRGTTPGEETLLVGNWPTVTYSDNTAVGGVTYYYVVQSSNTCGTSSISNEASAMLSCCTRYTDADDPCSTVYGAGTDCGPTVYTMNGC